MATNYFFLKKCDAKKTLVGLNIPNYYNFITILCSIHSHDKENETENIAGKEYQRQSVRQKPNNMRK